MTVYLSQHINNLVKRLEKTRSNESDYVKLKVRLNFTTNILSGENYLKRMTPNDVKNLFFIKSKIELLNEALEKSSFLDRINSVINSFFNYSINSDFHIELLQSLNQNTITITDNLDFILQILEKSWDSLDEILKLSYVKFFESKISPETLHSFPEGLAIFLLNKLDANHPLSQLITFNSDFKSPFKSLKISDDQFEKSNQLKMLMKADLDRLANIILANPIFFQKLIDWKKLFAPEYVTNLKPLLIKLAEKGCTQLHRSIFGTDQFGYFWNLKTVSDKFSYEIINLVYIDPKDETSALEYKIQNIDWRIKFLQDLANSNFSLFYQDFETHFKKFAPYFKYPFIIAMLNAEPKHQSEKENLSSLISKYIEDAIDRSSPILRHLCEIITLATSKNIISEANPRLNNLKTIKEIPVYIQSDEHIEEIIKTLSRLYTSQSIEFLEKYIPQDCIRHLNTRSNDPEFLEQLRNYAEEYPFGVLMAALTLEQFANLKNNTPWLNDLLKILLQERINNHAIRPEDIAFFIKNKRCLTEFIGIAPTFDTSRIKAITTSLFHNYRTAPLEEENEQIDTFLAFRSQFL